MCRVKLATILCLLLMMVVPIKAQPRYENRFTESLGDVLRGLEEQFGVQIQARFFQPDTVELSYASSRLRPYSLEESLDNISRALDLKYSKRGEGKYRIEPYEYYRRGVDDGRKLLEWLESKHRTLEEWDERRCDLLAQVRKMLDMESLYALLPDKCDVKLGKLRTFDGYTTQNFVMRSVDSVYFSGTIYAPKAGKKTKPLIISPSGHWEGGRMRPDQQLRMATFARMGAVAVDFDIVGWGAYAHTLSFPHHDPRAMRMQLLWAEQTLDWILSHRTDIDPERIAATGGSGGATHSLLLAIIDQRVRVLAPVVHLVSHFDGGCECESAVPVTGVCGGSCMPELLAAAMAPRSVLVVSSGGDWTASYPHLEYPFLKGIWKLYGRADNIRNAHFEKEGHDYGKNKRRVVYEFFASVLGLDIQKADERKVVVQPSLSFEE